jgi:hypothetical protein
MLSVLTDQIPYEQLAPGLLAFLASHLVDPWFALYRRFSLLIVQW